MLSLECSWLACGRNSCSPCQSVFNIYDSHATQKASVGMYSGCDYKSCLYTFWHCHPYFILKFYSVIFLLVSALFFIATTVSTIIEDGRWVRACAKVVATPLVNSIEHRCQRRLFRRPSSQLWDSSSYHLFYWLSLSLLSWLLCRLLRAVPCPYIEALSLHIPVQH